MIPYILYTALILTACLIFYKLLLQKETFFHLNRFVILSCMLLAFILPLLPVPQQLSFRKAPAAVATILQEAPAYQENVTQPIQPQAGIVAAKPIQKNQGISSEQVMQWIIYLYWFGVIIFALNFLMQAAVLFYTAYTKPVIKDGDCRIVEVSGDKAPCSFGNNIFINPEKYDWETYNQVLLHEKIHIEQKHTLDLLLAEIVLVFQWFNPFAWLWRKELESNLEFFTDNHLLQKDAVKKEAYQVSLLKVAAPHFPLSLTTNYNQSLLKKRLVMMNAKKSNVHTIWKYFFLLPLMVLFVCLFNEPAAQSQNISQKTKVKDHYPKDGDMKTEGNWFATIKGDKINIQFRNDDDDNNSSGSSFRLNEFGDLPKDKQGTFTLTREAGTMHFTGKFEGNKGMGQYKFDPDKSYSDQMQKEGIDVTADRDLMVFFMVNIKKSYIQMLKQNGYTELDKDKLIPLAALDINEAYISSIKEAGFKDISLDDLVPFKSLDITKTYIEEIRNAGYKNVTPDKIITFKAQGIDGKYISDFRNAAKAGSNQKNNTDQDEYITKSQEQKHNENNNSNKNDDDDDIIAFKSMNIDKAFINSFKEAGYNNLSNSDLIAMKSLGVTPEYIKTFQNAGYKNIPADDLIALKSQDITAALIKQYKELGLNDVTIDNIIGAKATGASPAFIKSMRGKGHNLKSLDNYIALKSVLGNPTD
jgi:beta-lactamase regulating signal transducer with metallopeptidase domain